jgi:hypothetical protein
LTQAFALDGIGGGNAEVDAWETGAELKTTHPVSLEEGADGAAVEGVADRELSATRVDD